MVEVQRIEPLLQQARQKILHIYASKFNVQKKADHSPVTEADLISHEILQAGLAKLNMGPVVSEESDYETQHQNYWLIDPLDGTKDFIHKTDQFAINIAFIAQSVPMWGLIYNVVEDELTWAKRGCGAFHQGRPLPQLKLRSDHRAAMSMFHANQDDETFFSENQVNEKIRIGSSLKFVRYALGEIDVYLRSRPTSEWDTASGQVIVEEVGGRIIQLSTGEKLKYNKANPLNPKFLLASKGTSWRYQDRILVL